MRYTKVARLISFRELLLRIFETTYQNRHTTAVKIRRTAGFYLFHIESALLHQCNRKKTGQSYIVEVITRIVLTDILYPAIRFSRLSGECLRRL